MYKDHQYTKTYDSTYLREVEDSKGRVVLAKEVRTQHYNIRLANIQGTKRMKVKTIADIGSACINSNLDAKLFFYIVSHQSKSSMLVKHNSKDFVDTTYLSKRFSTTPKKIRDFLSRLTKAKFLIRVKRNFAINPFILVPQVPDEELHLLQLWWEDGYISEFNLEDVVNY